MVLAVLAAGAFALQIGKLGGTAGERARAQTAADASALAGAAEGEEAARALAEGNGARLVGYAQQGLDTRVVVELGLAQATGKAHRDGSRPDPRLGARSGTGGGVPGEGLAPSMVSALDRAGQLLGERVPITSGYRSREKQQSLWDNRAANPYPVAAPGSSMHERGLAIDVPLSFVSRLESVASRVGLCHPFPQGDPVHFEVCR